MTDANRRKLILLAEARESALNATNALQRLVVTLEQLKGTKEQSFDDPLYASGRAAKDLVGTLIDIRQRLSETIGKVPS